MVEGGFATSVQVTVPVVLGSETASLQERLHDSVTLDVLVRLLETREHDGGLRASARAEVPGLE